MGKDLFNEKKSRFSLRKLNIGVCSVLLGTLIMIGGTAQADENTETTAATITPVAEAGETTASLVETRTVAETTPAATTPAATTPAATTPAATTPAATTPVASTAASTSAEASATVETPATSTAPATTAESATSQAAATSEAASTSAAPTSETAQASTSEAPQAGNSSEAEKPRVRSRRALSPANGISTRSFDSELQDAAQKTAIYSPGEKGQKQSYAGTVWLYRNGTINNDNQEDAKRLANVNVYLQYVTGKGFVSPVYKTTSGQDGTFVFDLSKPLANRLGATGEFKLAGDPKFAIRTWVENPDPTKYNVIKSGDQRTGFHGRLSRLNETWDFTAGINRIVGGQVVLQEKPNSEDYLLKPEADRQTGDQADGQFSRKGDYGTIRGRVWYELRDPSGSDARMYKKDSYDINATNVKVAASYVNDEVTRLFDKWKSEHSNYKLDDFKAAQAEIIKEYEAKNGKGSHIAETVVVPVDKDGNYRIPFRGLYGVSATQANSGLKISHKISDQEFGTLVKDEDLDNEHLMKWNGTIGQKHRHINTDYVYATVLVNDYAIWSNNYQSNMFEGTSDAVLPVGPSSLAAANISNTNFALIAPQPMHDILVYDNSDHFAKPGNTAESTTGGLMPSREYQIRWFKNGQAIGTATTVTSTADGTASSVPFTVPSDLTEAAIYTSAVFLQGENTDDLHSALALDSFTAVPNEDADKYTPTPKDQTVNVGETPDPKKSIGNVDDLPSSTTFEYKTPVDTTTPGDKSTTVVVTYPDGSKDEVPVTVKVVDPRTDADKNTPTPKDQTVNVGETPDPKKSIGNVDDLPSGTTFEYKTPVDTTTAGEKDATVVVTYPDGSKDEVPVKVTVKDPRTDADKNTPTAKDQTVNVGETPDAKGSIGNVSDLPSGTTFEYKTPVDTTTAGEKDATVVVTYPDGSKDEVPVKVTVVDPRMDADKNTPTAKDQTVNIGETPDAKGSIGNVSDLPSGTTFEYKTPVDTTTVGEKDATVVVTYPDGSKDEVPVKVTVVDPRTDADKNTPTAKDQTVNTGETPDAKGSIGNVSDLPNGTTFEYKTPVDTTTPGDKGTTVVVTYPDGSKDEVPVKVTVKDPRTDADKNTPTAKDQTVNVGETPDAKGSIGNVSDLPSGTTFEYKTPVDTTTAGEKDATVVVTYPDGSKDEVPVKVTVVDPRTDADKNTPTAKDQTVNTGETPDAKGSIGNVSDLPNGTTFEYKTPVDTTTVGEKDATVVVTYPDGSKDEVPVKVTVVDPRTDADKNTPTAKDQTVNIGETPDAKGSIGNVSDLPSGTTFEYKTPVDTTTVGEKDATVVVTYPDGSKDEVPVKVTVVDPSTDADKNTPTAKDQTVNIGEIPDAKGSIGNVSDLPNGTTFEYKTPVDTTTAGEKDATVVVTYPDGSKDEVPVKVTVKAPRTDADKNTPTPKDQTVNVGETPDAKNSIGNVGDLPEGTKFEFKTPVDTTTPGDKETTVVVTYLDGSKDEVPVTIKVVDPSTDADKNTPTPKDQTVNVGETPKAQDSIGNVGDLPEGTKFEFKTPVDTTTPGDKGTTVVVTYPDGSKDEVPVTIKVVDSSTDADKNTPTPKDQTVKPGDQPNAKDSIGNVGDLPEGTKFEYKTPVDTTTEGDKDATVVVTYPDGSKDEVPVKVIVKDPRTDADKNTPTAKDQTVKPGDQPNAKDSIGNVGDLPEGTKFEYKTPVDTTTEGDKDATVVVTYPDGSKDEVPVKVTVKDPRTDADKNTPTAKDQTVKPGDQPNAKDSIGNVGDLPEGTKFEYKTPVDTTTEGDKDAVVIVTYPDGSKDEVPVKVTVKAPRTDAEKNTPVAKDQTVKPGDQPNAKDSIGNVGDLPEGTKFEFKTPVDTTTPGEKSSTVVVTYPDGSKDEVPVKVIVKDPRTDADKNTPVAKDQTVKPGDQPNAKDSIGNVGDLPSGTKFEYKTPVDTTTEGEKDATVIVTYPDGSKDEVPVKVIVKDPRTDADKNTPVAKDQTVKPGDQPNAKDSIGNVGDLPEGTKFEYKTPVDTTTEGEKDATVVVTYPDGSKDEVPVKVIVKDPRTDADKNTPVAKDQTVKPGDQPNAKDSIGNVGDLPEGTKFEYKTPVDTTTEGEKDATVVVTYPDGSKDEVPVKVIVKDPRTDADKNTPTVDNQETKATPVPTVHKPAPASDTVHVASKATPAATDTKQALPETGENTSLLATLLGGLMTVAGLGLAGKRKKED